MKIIDGSYGEGGGQIFRTSLTLAMLLGEPVRIKNIRSGRSKPGLLRQHLACLNAAKEICKADVEGGLIGSQDVTFIPGKVNGGEFEFAVGTAGSTTLIFQTVVLPLLFANTESALTLSGGTHNGMAPSYEFLEKSFLPVLREIGCDIAAHLACYGFYPAGGGVWHVRIKPCEGLKQLCMEHSNEKRELRALAVSSKLPRHIAERELKQVIDRCELDENATEIREVESAGPGNMLSLQLSKGSFVSVFDSFAQKRLSAEKVANQAIRMLAHFERAEVAVEEHLADQLLLPLVCGEGGTLTTTEPSQHLRTNIWVIQAFVGKRILLSQSSDKVWELRVNGLAKRSHAL